MKNNRRGILLTLIVLVAAVLAAVMAYGFLQQEPAAAGTVPNRPHTAGSMPEQTTDAAVRSFDAINLGYGLEITDAGSYAGMYMEDGSDEIVSDVMMIVVRNSGEQDFQLARITVSYGEELYSFSLTNLPAGGRAVLLELERKPAPEGQPISAVLEDPVLFSEPMDLCADAIGIGGMEGMLNVENISNADIPGDVYVYYKYASEDLFYGGITFRVRVEGGLKAGELRQIPAGHFDPDSCAVVQVVIAP